jgi:zinc-ribbon domain
VFCPNCGTQNDSAATLCKKCGFKLSGLSVPKFKGTMMLNSQQTVQELIDEHRRKQAEVALAEKRASNPPSKRGPGSVAPPSALSGTKGPVLQPPRAAPSSRGRMGGTMMGVAPPAGGVMPPAAGLAPGHEGAIAPPLAPPDEVPQSEEASGIDAASHGVSASSRPTGPDEGPAAPLAATGPLPVAAAAAEEDELDAGSAASPVDHPHHPVAVVPSPDAAGPADPGVPDAAADRSPALAELRAADTEPPRNRAVAATVALPEQAAAASGTTSAVPARIRPLDVVLIVCTFGVYGIVLWLKQRPRPT